MRGLKKISLEEAKSFLVEHYDIKQTSKGIMVTPKDSTKYPVSNTKELRLDFWSRGLKSPSIINLKSIIKDIASTEKIINEQIISYCKYKKIRQIDFEKAGYASKQTISNIWHGKQKPGCEFLERFISENKDLNARWLFTGIGEMIDKGDPASEAMVKFLSEQLEKVEKENKELNREIGALKAQIKK
ncbi:hypothetical protein D0T84_14040 [Dysgonomonas sp. 521]|uniref:hypothetical protein n=1 Tax=Dysgonomonas sp. 521 TaxID=2302932 RepID=UPI0013D80442|nr:hypothetical protein [Dysgonomonas sp. 521]NDV96025.1 hypothetical protein [Dysgonomonas sp. 521]